MYNLEMQKIEEFLLMHEFEKDSNGYFILDKKMMYIDLSIAFISDGFKTTSINNFDEFIEVLNELY